MNLVRLTHDNLESEHICCAIANNNDCQVSSKYAIAKYENIRIEVVTACEEGRASMGGLCMYLDFIAEKDREFFKDFTTTWWKRNGYV